jgi:hypothetical protein
LTVSALIAFETIVIAALSTLSAADLLETSPAIAAESSVEVTEPDPPAALTEFILKLRAASAADVALSVLPPSMTTLSLAAFVSIVTPLGVSSMLMIMLT